LWGDSWSISSAGYGNKSEEIASYVPIHSKTTTALPSSLHAPLND
jgi:hypothetical protein